MKQLWQFWYAGSAEIGLLKGSALLKDTKSKVSGQVSDG